MPFDVLTKTEPTEAAEDTRPILERAMIVGVPMETLEGYKAQYRAAFMKEYPHRKAAGWRELDKHTWIDGFESALRALETYTGSTTPDAVRETIDRADRALHEQGAETEKVVGYFDRDPYVTIKYRTKTEEGTVCVAIWDGDEVEHIATIGEPAPQPEAPSWVRHVLGK